MSGDWWPSFTVKTGGGPPPPASHLLSREQAEALRGRLLLIGVTERGADGERHFQTYGRVVNVAPSEGVTIECMGAHAGRMFTVPPDPQAFAPAPPNDYRLRSTGDVVRNPDFLVTFDVLSRSDTSVSEQDPNR